MFKETHSHFTGGLLSFSQHTAVALSWQDDWMVLNWRAGVKETHCCIHKTAERHSSCFTHRRECEQQQDHVRQKWKRWRHQRGSTWKTKSRHWDETHRNLVFWGSVPSVLPLMFVTPTYNSLLISLNLPLRLN